MAVDGAEYARRQSASDGAGHRSTAPGQLEGLTTTVLPARRAGRILFPITGAGQLKGRMAATTRGPLLDDRGARRARLECLGNQRRQPPRPSRPWCHIEQGFDEDLAVLTGQQGGGGVQVERIHGLVAGLLQARTAAFEAEGRPCRWTSGPPQPPGPVDRASSPGP